MRRLYWSLLAASACACLAGGAQAQIVVGPATPVQGTYGTIIAKAGTQRPLSAEAEKLLGQLALQKANNPDQYRATLEGLSPDAQALVQRNKEIFSNLLGMIGAAAQARDALIDSYWESRRRDDPMNGAVSRAATAAGGSALSLSPERLGARLTVDAGYFDDDMVTLAGTPAHRGDHDGAYANARLSVDLDPLTRLGVGVTWSRSTGRAAGGRQSARGEFLLGNIYGSAATPGGTMFDVVIAGGVLDASTRRQVMLGGTSYTLVAESRPTVLGAEVGISQGFFARDFVMMPRLSLRGAHIVFGGTTESGGLPALRYDRYVADSLTGRAGVTFSGTGSVRPWFSGSYVHEFIDRPDGFGANFAIASGAGGQFLLATQDRDWGELGGGLTFASRAVAVSLGADTIVSRSDVSGATYRGSLALRF